MKQSLIELNNITEYVSNVFLWFFNQSTSTTQQWGQTVSQELCHRDEGLNTRQHKQYMKITEGVKHNKHFMPTDTQNPYLDVISLRQQIEKVYNSLSQIQQRIIYANYGAPYSIPPSLQYVFTTQSPLPLAPTILAISQQITYDIQVAERLQRNVASPEDHIYILSLTSSAKKELLNTIKTAWLQLPKDMKLNE